MKYELPKLPYSYDALEPSIDAKTMEIHHTKHHQGYIDKLNAVIEKYPGLQDQKLEDLLKNLQAIEQMEESDKTILKNNGGGHLNHSLFWQMMAPAKEVDKNLLVEIEKTFGYLDEFKKTFTQAAVGQFGSGWAWLVRNEAGKLDVYSLPNQDSPYLKGHTPIIGLDVWEHAYYLKYQNRRAEYVENWWKVLKLL
ncbi:superoxide dismutase [Candidatus Azambacteria bacterium RIFCSPHIGHO2_01_FULL_44_55]|uniref:Superoxide dismutase n=1 Tax=Candidatus Azambacteria bacterium RIFCSPLOWO2_02_FULL_44_14 TaxID=1797306 RepID=A0A1F5CBQ3_9BACT|nr:MAG: superoxide dismutase [Candidatus Azambacteria bacterium RIFCSPLOWO2_01_FULL_44_84]OGD33185.1 MAG: superoxide dismutase [Candidatus Azambacteria bacterium RIFCSPHIGHO2_02_FULL_45_18]OGD40257.1 MAG: superoxide dismutase [Candidatus Azambacteria bacterium RIFCSPHIGHO2_01_FULL_44_55]OGD40290.1 MAG: superoxide dismutase [Candidatus Azambacteria bacterium RIFCSPLOWO2_02_FULL_44_14]OGD49621.1 MAG: superoxide dismutase [Candidatus Azambacteria bacterium RIFOXYD1_FULL_44_10]